MKTPFDELTAVLSALANTPEDLHRIVTALKAIDKKYNLSRKMAQEPGLKEIISQLVGRIYGAYDNLAAVKGKRILDIASGSNTSRAPSFVFVNTPFGEQRVPIPSSVGYTAQFEPWFCRILLELGADPVGVDQGDLSQEAFEHYPVDLGKRGALSFFPDHSFDAVQDSRLFGSPEFTAQYPSRVDRLRVAAEIWEQEQRLLKFKGIVIHSDAAQLMQQK